MNTLNPFYIIHANPIACKYKPNLDRVKFFWEKSSAGIEWPEFGASFEQGSSAGELAYPASAP